MNKTARILLIMLSLLLPHVAAYAMTGAEAIKTEIVRTISESSPWKAKDIEVDDIRLSGFKDTDMFDKITISSQHGTKNIGKSTYTVTLLNDGKVIKTFMASAHIRVFSDAVVALNTLKIAHRIEGSDVKVARREIGDSTETISSVDDVVGMIVKRPVSAGAFIKKESIKPEASIKRGERIAIVVEGKNLAIKSMGVANEDGYLGSILTARTNMGKEVKGRVTGPGEISVEF